MSILLLLAKKKKPKKGRPYGTAVFPRFRAAGGVLNYPSTRVQDMPQQHRRGE